jgi:predicted ArsR family transcriptional regulator
MNQLSIYDVTFFKHGGNEFSAQANKSIKSSKEQLRHRIYQHIQKVGDATSEEIVEALDLPLQTVSARMSELKAIDRIKLVDRRKTKSGRSAGAWGVK